MKRFFLFALPVLALACSSRQDKKADVSEPWAPRFGRTVSAYQILDADTRDRVGFLDKTTYDDGRVLYWVRDRQRSEKLGYILPTGRAYRFVWYAGQRSADPEDLGADVISAGARRILGYGRPVMLEQVDLEAWVRERDPKPEPQSTKSDADDEGCGCGDE